MICHLCNQDSIDIKNGHILCDVCGLDIDISSNLEKDHFFDLFFYNENLLEAEKLGKEALIEGKDIKDNPYSLSSNQIMSNKRWKVGYNKEKESYELGALSLSSEKIETQLREDIEIIQADLVKETKAKESLEKQANLFIHISSNLIEYFCSKLLCRKIIGTFLQKDISCFQQDYKQMRKDNWEEIPGK